MGSEVLMSWIVSKMGIKLKGIRRVMLPVTIAGWMNGMGVMEFPIGNRWPTTSVFYAVALMSGYSFVVEKSIENIDVVVVDRSVSGKIIVMALFYGNVCLSIVSILLSWMRLRKVEDIMRRIESAERKLETLKISRDYSMLYCQQLFGLTGQFLAVVAFFLIEWFWSSLDNATTWQKIAAAVATYYPVVVISIGDLSFLAFVRFVALRFGQLNECLLEMSASTYDWPQHKRVLEYTKSKDNEYDNVIEKRTNDDCNFMKAARAYHHELIKIAYRINDTFGIQALLSMSVTFVLITGLLYTTCRTILWTTSNQKIIDHELINTGCWLIFYTCRIVFINSACARASNKAKETSSVICQLHEPMTKKTYRDQIRDFTLQMTQHTLTFTACGFFTLNYGLIQKMVSSMTTYLVILVQISEPS